MTNSAVEKLRTALEKKYTARVDAERVRPGRYRFTIVSPRFEKKSHLRRQDEVWAFIGDSVSREQLLDISLVLTLSPDETEILLHG